jgi:cellulose biosynthesis protein BcsQ
MPYVHFDEAKRAAEAALADWLNKMDRTVESVLLVRDLFGKFRLAIWASDAIETAGIAETLAERCDAWWTGEVLQIRDSDEITRKLYDEAARLGQSSENHARLHVLDRHRTRAGWFAEEPEPLWSTADGHCPIVVFYSFKGGLGRSTCLASFAIQRARAGDRVCVLDLDLDSPGVGRLLASDVDGLTAPWGVVDFLVEHPPADTSLADYYHRCDRVAGTGELIVFPAGRMNETYADKLARVDMEDPVPAPESALGTLLLRARNELKPRWILIDARTGISESAGRLLSGLAHLHVLLGTTQDQSWQGLNRVLDRLGKVRVERGLPQHEVLIVQAMVPPGGEAGRMARDAFSARSEREFTDRYYAAEDLKDADDTFAATLWTTRDMDDRTAPNEPVPISYEAKLADFGDIAEIADLLCTGPYADIATRIEERFQVEVDA